MGARPDHLIGKTWWPVALFVLALACTPAAADTNRPRTVLTVHWGAENFPATPVADLAIRDALIAGRDLSIDYFSEYLESDRFDPQDAALALRDSIARKFRGRQVDVVIAMSDPALRFVLDHRLALFGDAPIVFSGDWVPNDRTRSRGSGLTGVTRVVAYAETMKLALQLHPSTERVFVVARSSDRRSTKSVRAELDDLSSRVQVTYIDEATLEGLLAAVRAIPPRSVILFIRHSQQEAGHLMYPDEVARLVVRASHVPVYGTSAFYLGTGIVGGVLRSTHDTATRVGEMARRILMGAPAQEIPIEAARVVPTVDWRQVQRWGIDPSLIPSGADIRFRTPTAWESYRRYILGGLAVVGAQSVLIAGLLTQRARRRRAEEIIRLREDSLRTNYQRIRQLAGDLINAQEAARAEIARDLHDGVCQQLVGISMAIGGLKCSSRYVDDTATQQELATVEHEALRAVESVRRLSHDLHPTALQLVGLDAALRAHCIEVEQQHDVQVDFQTCGDIARIRPHVALCLFRIVQEALRNGAVHGGARQLAVSMAIREHGEPVELIVSDDGRGFDLETVRRNGSGLGLVSMEERAHVIGGDVRIMTGPGRGTMIRVRVPA